MGTDSRKFDDYGRTTAFIPLSDRNDQAVSCADIGGCAGAFSWKSFRWRAIYISAACCVIEKVTAEVPHVKVISAARCTGAAFSATVTVRECSPASPAACERTIHSTPSVISACHGPEAENARSISPPAAGRVRACGVPSANMS